MNKRKRKTKTDFIQKVDFDRHDSPKGNNSDILFIHNFILNYAQ